MTCKDCIYRVMCYKHEHYGYGDEYNEEPCEMFKNKADFVEVVRCGKCKHGEVSIISRTKDGEEKIACYCNAKNKVSDLEYYCAYGERRDT